MENFCASKAAILRTHREKYGGGEQQGEAGPGTERGQRQIHGKKYLPTSLYVHKYRPSQTDWVLVKFDTVNDFKTEDHL